MALALALLLLALAAAPAAVVGAQRAGAKPPGTLVFAALGDWGWATEGADASFLVNGLRGGCAAFDPAAARAGANASAYRASPGGARCLDGASGVQGILSRLGLQAVAQRATARALAGACARAGGCDAVALTGDSFYPNGVASADDPQWVSAFESVYTPQLFGGAVFASCLGNHCYSTLGTPGGSGAAQVEYSTTRSPRFWLPAPAYDRTFASTDGTTRLQLVVMDSAPLTDAYLYAGASGAGFAPGAAAPRLGREELRASAILTPLTSLSHSLARAARRRHGRRGRPVQRGDQPGRNRRQRVPAAPPLQLHALRLRRRRGLRPHPWPAELRLRVAGVRGPCCAGLAPRRLGVRRDGAAGRRRVRRSARRADGAHARRQRAAAPVAASGGCAGHAGAAAGLSRAADRAFWPRPRA